MVKILKHDNPDHKIKMKIRQFQVMGKSIGQINNISMQSPGAPDRVSVICLMHDIRHLS